MMIPAPYCLNFWVMISNGIHWWHFLLHGCHKQILSMLIYTMYSQALSTFACAALQDLKVTLAITTCLVFVMILWNYHLILVNIGFFFWYNFLPRQMRSGNHEERFQLFEFQELHKWCCCWCTLELKPSCISFALEGDLSFLFSQLCSVKLLWWFYVCLIQS